MNATLKRHLTDPTSHMGLIFFAISFAVFAISVNHSVSTGDPFSVIFFINYVLTVIFFILVLIDSKAKTNRLFRFPNFTHNVLLLQLFNVSAYSLNRTLTVFQVSTNWVTAFLLLSNGLLLLHVFRRNFKVNWVSHLIVVAANLGLLFHFYESIYVLQGYVFAFIGFWFFGIPLHIFVPGLFVLVYIKVVRQFLKKSPRFWYTTLTTWIAALFLIGFMTIRFAQVDQTIADSFHTTQQPYFDNSLPSWVHVSQKLRRDWATKRALLAGFEYSSSRDMFRNRWNRRLQHDPLVVIAHFVNGNLDLPRGDRTKILRFMFDARHQTEERLWRGDKLSTTDIVTNVQLFPAHRLAYTEKTFKIHNRSKRLRNQQEALYSFYLPEGSVVTSAALWVDGKEEPAYLTTKSKADSAYQTIVGRERRDPLLLHWQEGNRVTVRVFPCTPAEDRQFKIGITTPLRKTGKQLTYENIDFEGPYWNTANESINVVAEGRLSNMDAPITFRKYGTGYQYSGPYNSRWSLSFDALPLDGSAFSFNGYTYQLQPHNGQKAAFDPGVVYLDINGAWSKRELNALWPAIRDKVVLVYANHRMERMTDDNRSDLFRLLNRQNYSLFPFQKIADPDRALVVSKGSQLTPTLSDLENSPFLDQLAAFFKDRNTPVRLYTVGNELSPYLKTLQEFRSIQVERGSADQLARLLRDGEFATYPERENVIVNQYGQFQIVKSVGEAPASSAPDHLMRLFAYNDLMRTIGKDYSRKKERAEEWIPAAKEAYVVTPVSSLIVLETQEDYDRFDIKKSKNSLQNAAIGDSGAVPEPHEWLLILLAVVMAVWLYFRQNGVV